jgi:phytoene dehydrogenase-like protein
MKYDAAIVGAGPNGLAAAIALARNGRSELLLEAADAVGGGTRSAALTLPGFSHDVCSAVHPLAVTSPFFRNLPLAEHGKKLVRFQGYSRLDERALGPRRSYTPQAQADDMIL